MRRGDINQKPIDFYGVTIPTGCAVIAAEPEVRHITCKDGTDYFETTIVIKLTPPFIDEKDIIKT